MDWRDIPPDREVCDPYVRGMVVEVWRHVLRGIKSGHLLTFVKTEECLTLISRNCWPDVESISDTEPSTFTSLRSSPNFTFSYNSPDAKYVDTKGRPHEGELLVDDLTSQIFQTLFNLPKYYRKQQGRWKALGVKGELPAMMLGDLLDEWSESSKFEAQPMRRTLISTLKQSVQNLPDHEKWLTPHAVFNNTGCLVDPAHIIHVENSVGQSEIELGKYWVGSWVVGRDWLRKFCKHDPVNRPFPQFWEKPTPLPPILGEITKKPSPLKGRSREGIKKRNQEWLTQAKRLKTIQPNWSKSEVCRHVAKAGGENEKPETIRRTLNDKFPGWEKKVGKIDNKP